jgi:hypothetical protein
MSRCSSSSLRCRVVAASPLRVAPLLLQCRALGFVVVDVVRLVDILHRRWCFFVLHHCVTIIFGGGGGAMTATRGRICSLLRVVGVHAERRCEPAVRPFLHNTLLHACSSVGLPRELPLPRCDALKDPTPPPLPEPPRRYIPERWWMQQSGTSGEIISLEIIYSGSGAVEWK